ncbi:MAG: 4Fe-4S dicluster domain-containing protein [Actinobacteria bacterium]|nr:4Fe-4S dicluster domain-containing protein [Actinomycetota bacterium]
MADTSVADASMKIVRDEGREWVPEYGRLLVEPEKCTGCRTCELFCSLRNFGEVNPARARIHVVRSQEDNIITTVPVVCQQCEDPLCMAMCPAGALSRNLETNAVVVDHDKCLGCRTCVQVCPFGAPSVDPRTGKSEKCDLCGGEPVCVKFCSQEALKFVTAEEESMTRKRDMVDKYVEHLRAASSGGTI